MLKLFLVLALLTCMSIVAHSREEFHIDGNDNLVDAKTAHKQSVQAAKDNEKFERRRAWDVIAGAIEAAINEGKNCAQVDYDRTLYPEFEKQLTDKGYKVVDNGNNTTNIYW
jgi:hypothetical protein